MRGAIWKENRTDHQKGLSYSEIGRKYNTGRRPAKKHAQSDSRPEYVLTDSKPSKPDPYKVLAILKKEEKGEKTKRDKQDKNK